MLNGNLMPYMKKSYTDFIICAFSLMQPHAPKIPAENSSKECEEYNVFYGFL